MNIFETHTQILYADRTLVRMGQDVCWTHQLVSGTGVTVHSVYMEPTVRFRFDDVWFLLCGNLGMVCVAAELLYSRAM